jgi:hypothetical protein
MNATGAGNTLPLRYPQITLNINEIKIKIHKRAGIFETGPEFHPEIMRVPFSRGFEDNSDRRNDQTKARSSRWSESRITWI